MRIEKPTNRTTLLEVAALAGVSATTASLVLSGKSEDSRISESASSRVRDAALKLNYAPNLLTSALRRGRTHILSFFSSFRHRERDDHYMDRLSAAVEYAGGNLGYDVLIHCNFRRSPEEIYRFLNGGIADGLILFAPTQDDPLLGLLRKSSLPVVLLGCRDADHTLSSIVDDAESGIHQCVEALLKSGHRRIAALTAGGPLTRDANFRVNRVCQLLAESGNPVPDRWVGDCTDKNHTVFDRWMAESEPPTAIFCWHDRVAYWLLEECKLRGIQVPGDLSIVGYDRLRWPAATSHTAASVGPDLETYAREAVTLLDRVICSGASPLIEETLPVYFSPGTTLAPPTSTPYRIEAS